MAYKVGNTTVINNSANLGSVDGNSLNLANNANISAGSDGYSADILLVGGGGAGGRQNSNASGCGAGGVVATTLTISKGQNYSVNIGAGAAGGNNNTGIGANGGDTVFGGKITAFGGAGSFGNSNTYQYGGTQGGGRNASESLASQQKYKMKSEPGRGFQGEVALQRGGAGVLNPSTGNSGGQGFTWFDGVARGGGGGGYYEFSSGTGGTGGGGNGAYNSANSGQANTGGGGGARNEQGTSGGGGSGVCIVRYAGSQVGNGGTVTNTGGYTYHRFNSSGTFGAGN